MQQRTLAGIEEAHSEREGWPASYRTALDHFVDALSGRGSIGPTLDEALKAQAIAEAATRSLASAHMEPIKYA